MIWWLSPKGWFRAVTLTKSFYQTMEVAESTSASIEEIAASLETQTETMDKLQIHQACWRNRQRICMNWWASLN